MTLAEDVKQTIEEMQCLIDDLRARYPEERYLLIHVAYNWRVEQLLRELQDED